MTLSELEIYFLHQFEESDEDLFQLEFDVKAHFNINSSFSTIREITIRTIRRLHTKKLIELYECNFKEVRTNYFELISMTKLPDRMVDLILNDNNNWD